MILTTPPVFPHIRFSELPFRDRGPHLDLGKQKRAAVEHPVEVATGYQLPYWVWLVLNQKNKVND